MEAKLYLILNEFQDLKLKVEGLKTKNKMGHLEMTIEMIGERRTPIDRGMRKMT